MSDQPLSLLYDAQDSRASAALAPATARPGQTLSATAQGGMVQLGQDAGGVARVPRIDGNGSQYSVPVNPAGGNAQVYASQPAGAQTAQYGQLMMARQDSPTPSTFYPLLLDPAQNLNVHAKSKSTFRVLTNAVTCAANKALLCVWNGSTMVLRLNECRIYVPPGGNSGNLLGLGSGTTYYNIFCEMRRISAMSGGTSVTAVMADSSEALASGVTISREPTSATSVAVYHRQDAVVSTLTGLPWLNDRNDPNMKALVIRPGEGAAIYCAGPNITINNATGNGTQTAAIDLELIMTQAVA